MCTMLWVVRHDYVRRCREWMEAGVARRSPLGGTCLVSRVKTKGEDQLINKASCSPLKGL